MALSEVIIVFDQQSQDLLWFALMVAIVIAGGVFSGLWYQIQAQLRVDKQTISVLLAIGACESYILLSKLKHSAIALIVAVLLSLFIFISLNGTAENQLQFDLIAAVCAMIITVSLSIVAMMLPLQKLLKQPIQQSLREL